MTTIKLKAQLPEVDNALAGARIRRGTISAGYNHVIPNQPQAKNVLNTKRNTAATIPGFVWPTKLVLIAKTTMDRDMPAAPNNIRGRRPAFSMMKIGSQEAMKYSVPLQAAKIRDMSEPIPMLVW